jgi:hypothetical protein
MPPSKDSPDKTGITGRSSRLAAFFTPWICSLIFNTRFVYFGELHVLSPTKTSQQKNNNTKMPKQLSARLKMTQIAPGTDVSENTAQSDSRVACVGLKVINQFMNRGVKEALRGEIPLIIQGGCYEFYPKTDGKTAISDGRGVGLGLCADL